MEQLITENIMVVWLIADTLCIALEAMAVPGIGFLFAGMAAITIGGLLNFDIVETDEILKQFALFLGLTFGWAALLWVPLKKFRKKQMDNNFSNIIGEVAIVESDLLNKKKDGKVKWSGTIMRAKLSQDSSTESINKGQEVVITAIDGNLLTVTQQSNKE